MTGRVDILSNAVMENAIMKGGNKPLKKEETNSFFFEREKNKTKQKTKTNPRPSFFHQPTAPQAGGTALCDRTRSPGIT